MGRSVIEWNTADVLQRKYSESWVIFENGSELVQYFVENCDAGPIFYCAKGSHTLPPIYYPFESGYYLSPKDESLLLERKFSPHKSYKIGLSGENWLLYKINNGTGELVKTSIKGDLFIDLLNPPERKKFLSRGIGVINRKYFLSAHQISFKGTQIGSREGKIIVLDQPYFLKDLVNTLGPEWQIS